MKHVEKNWFEWCVFGMGSVLVLATIAYLSYAAATSDGQPAKVSVELGPAERRGEEFAVPVHVVNRGDEAAKAVQIEVRLSTADGGEERSHLEIQLLPSRATRHGWAVFSSDPADAAAMVGRAVGFEKP